MCARRKQVQEKERWWNDQGKREKLKRKANDRKERKLKRETERV